MLKNILLKTKEKPKCLGLIFRSHVSCYISSHRSIEVKKSLRLLKRKSCKGCSQCEWIWEALPEEIYNGEIEDFIPNIKNGKIYKLKFNYFPGTYEYPDDGEIEYRFEEIKKEE